MRRSVDSIDGDVTVEGGIPVTAPGRTFCDAGLVFPDHEMQRLVDHAVATGMTTRRELIDFRRRLGEHGRNGVIRLDLAVDGLPTGAASTESGPEVNLLRRLLSSGFPGPARQHAVNVGGRSYLLDLRTRRQDSGSNTTESMPTLASIGSSATAVAKTTSPVPAGRFFATPIPT